MVAGIVLGGAFYRNALLGLLLIPVAVGMVGLVEAAAGPDYFGPAPAGLLAWLGLAPEGGSPGVTAASAAGVFAVGLALAVALIRDLPIRTRT